LTAESEKYATFCTRKPDILYVTNECIKPKKDLNLLRAVDAVEIYIYIYIYIKL